MHTLVHHLSLGVCLPRIDHSAVALAPRSGSVKRVVRTLSDAGKVLNKLALWTTHTKPVFTERQRCAPVCALVLLVQLVLWVALIAQQIIRTFFAPVKVAHSVRVVFFRHRRVILLSSFTVSTIPDANFPFLTVCVLFLYVRTLIYV